MVQTRGPDGTHLENDAIVMQLKIYMENVLLYDIMTKVYAHIGQQ